jgi:hypothetical protein
MHVEDHVTALEPKHLGEEHNPRAGVEHSLSSLYRIFGLKLGYITLSA